MNYRHAFHAGNFADLVKHAALTCILARLPGPVSVLDTHAGAGLYDLGGERARKSGEAAAGILRLMETPDSPPVFEALKAAVRRLNPKGGVALYPGSPVIAAQMLGRGDSYLGCELRADDAALLNQALKPWPHARAVATDGYGEVGRTKAGRGSRLVLIDPPFEKADDYAQAAGAVGTALARDPAVCVIVWLPLKDLDTLDRFVGRLEDLEPPRTLIAECRLRPLINPMALNGCALAVIGAPEGAEAEIAAACVWTAERLGDAGGEGRAWIVGG